MNYQEAVDWLYTQLPMYQNIGIKAYKKNLDNSLALSAYFQSPELTYKTIHVGGTNGKGSTCHLLASVLQDSGYTVGIFSSPHLKNFTERIKVNGIECPQNFVARFVTNHQEKLNELQVSFFEMTSAMAFQYFKEQLVDVAIIEVGLGGRLDSTNIIKPILSIITNISLDHTAILGNTLAEIASEKAGIIKQYTPVVIGEVVAETKKVFIAKSDLENAKIYFAQDDLPINYWSDLVGIYQQANKQTVLKAINILQQNFKISEQNIINGFAKVVKNTSFFGRWQTIDLNPTIICDTAHNEAGLSYVVTQIQQQSFENLHLVLGFVKDKNVIAMLNLFPREAKYYFSAPCLERKLSITELKEIVPKNINATYYDTVTCALNAAKKNANKNDLIFVGGSTFVVAEVL